VCAFVTQHLQRPTYPTSTTSPPPDLRLPLVHTWRASLSASERWLPPDESTPAGVGLPLLFFVRDAQLTCREAANGKPNWTQELPHAPSWLAQHANLVLIAGPRRIQALRAADGQELWHFQAEHWPNHVPCNDTDADANALSAFRLTAGRLFCLQGGRRLLALDVETGAALWSHWAPGARIGPLGPGGQFYPRYHADADWVVAQTSGGQQLIFESHTGRLAHQLPTGLEPWSQTPVAVQERRVCLVPNAHRVVMLDPASGYEVWTYALDRHASLSGEPPQVLANSQTVVVRVARNYGYELQCLDAVSGARRWPAPVYVGGTAFDLTRGVLGSTAVYFVQEGFLHARSLADGKPLWERPLTGVDHWQVVAARNYLLAYPLHSTRRPRVIGQRPSFQVVCCDPNDGQPVQCLNFPAPTERAGICVRDGKLAVVLGDTVWGLSSVVDQ
jgi:outer membrane protein assembly factor BamB